MSVDRVNFLADAKNLSAFRHYFSIASTVE